jgi:hypothetical protein
MNVIMKRWIQSCRRELLDRMRRAAPKAILRGATQCRPKPEQRPDSRAHTEHTSAQTKIGDHESMTKEQVSGMVTVGRVGLEPTTRGLKVRCSAN